MSSRGKFQPRFEVIINLFHSDTILRLLQWPRVLSPISHFSPLHGLQPASEQRGQAGRWQRAPFTTSSSPFAASPSTPEAAGQWQETPARQTNSRPPLQPPLPENITSALPGTVRASAWTRNASLAVLGDCRQKTPWAICPCWGVRLSEWGCSSFQGSISDEAKGIWATSPLFLGLHHQLRWDIDVLGRWTQEPGTQEYYSPVAGESLGASSSWWEPP